MRLRELKIRCFRNLKNFEVSFDDEPVTVLLGKNGAAKSNLIEFIAHIFAEMEMERWPQYPYFLRYECRTKEITIDARFTNLEVSLVTIGTRVITEGKEVVEEENRDYRQFVNKAGKKFKDYLPTNVIVYYSGLSNRMATICDPIRNIYENNLRDGNAPRLRRVFLTDGSHSPLILFSFLAHKSDWAESFLKARMGIVKTKSVLLRVTPNEASKISFDGMFWDDAPASVLETLRRLHQRSLPLHHQVQKKPKTHRSKELKIRIDKHYELKALYMFFNELFPVTNLITKEEDTHTNQFVEPGDGSALTTTPAFTRPKDLLQALDDLQLAGYEVTLSFKLEIEGAREPVSLTHLSEGEQQLLTVIGMLRFAKENDTLFLLDEPDTHLNPQWSYTYKKLMQDAMEFDRDPAHKTSQVLLATHDPVLIVDMAKSNIRLMERKTTKNHEAPDEAETSIVAKAPRENPHDLGVARILRELQDLPSILGTEKLEKLEEKRRLAFKQEQLSPDEEKRLEQLAEETEDIDLATHIEDPLYLHFISEVVNSKDYGLLTRELGDDSRFDRLRVVARKARESLLRKAHKAKVEE